jgi:hypothetical protein
MWIKSSFLPILIDGLQLYAPDPPIEGFRISDGNPERPTAGDAGRRMYAGSVAGTEGRTLHDSPFYCNLYSCNKQLGPAITDWQR